MRVDDARGVESTSRSCEPNQNRPDRDWALGISIG